MILARTRSLKIIAASILICSAAFAKDPSECYGTTSDGRLENGWQLPANGNNFQAYSTTGRLLGRTYVHSTVHSVVVAAYTALEKSTPEKTYVYGETGKKRGGEFSPHKTHRNGLSVDFMVPLLNAEGRSVPMPTSVFNKWGYDLDFDKSGRRNGLQIDAKAIAEHIYQLDVAAKASGIGIWRVIFDPALQPMLHSSPHWEYLKKNIQFSTRRSWVRHDDHYHIDFDVPCRR